MPNDDRPKVGPADPETRRRLLQEELAKPTGPTGVATPPVVKKRKTLTLGQALDPKVKRDTAHSGKTVDELVDEAVDGAKLSY